MGKFLKKFKAVNKFAFKTAINPLSLRKNLTAKPKNDAVPKVANVSNSNFSPLIQKPNQDCACIRRQRNRATMIRRKRQLPEQNLNQ